MTKEMHLYEDKVIVRIPEGFEATPDASKFFLSAKPDYAYVEKETNAVISATKTDNPISDTDIERRIAEYCALYKRAVPNFANYRIAKKETESGKEIAAFYYTSTSPERDLYNFFILTSLQGCELIFTLHCAVDNVPRFGADFMSTLNSIDVIK